MISHDEQCEITKCRKLGIPPLAGVFCTCKPKEEKPTYEQLKTERDGLLAQLAELKVEIGASVAKTINTAKENDERKQDLSEALNHGLNVLCDAMGVDTEMYDRDQSDICCYMDCFDDASELLKSYSIYRDAEEGEMRSHKIESLESQLAEAREANRWIPVSERLPEEDLKVLAWTEADGFIDARCYGEEMWLSSDRVHYMNVTHWKPITKPE